MLIRVHSHVLGSKTSIDFDGFIRVEDLQLNRLNNMPDMFSRSNCLQGDLSSQNDLPSCTGLAFHKYAGFISGTTLLGMTNQQRALRISYRDDWRF